MSVSSLISTSIAVRLGHDKQKHNGGFSVKPAVEFCQALTISNPALPICIYGRPTMQWSSVAWTYILAPDAPTAQPSNPETPGSYAQHTLSSFEWSACETACMTLSILCGRTLHSPSAKLATQAKSHRRRDLVWSWRPFRTLGKPFAS